MYTSKIDTSSSGDNTLQAADTNRRIRVYSYVIVAGGTVSVKWKSGSTDLSGAMPLVANGGISAHSPGSAGAFVPLLQTAANEALVLNLSGAVQVSGHYSWDYVR